MGVVAISVLAMPAAVCCTAIKEKPTPMNGYHRGQETATLAQALTHSASMAAQDEPGREAQQACHATYHIRRKGQDGGQRRAGSEDVGFVMVEPDFAQHQTHALS